MIRKAWVRCKVLSLDAMNARIELTNAQQFDVDPSDVRPLPGAFAATLDFTHEVRVEAYRPERGASDGFGESSWWRCLVRVPNGWHRITMPARFVSIDACAPSREGEISEG